MSTPETASNKVVQTVKIITARTEMEMEAGAAKTKEYTERSVEFLEAKAKEAEELAAAAADKVVSKVKGTFATPAAPAAKK